MNEEIMKIMKTIKKIDTSFDFNILPFIILLIAFIIIVTYLIKIEVNSNGKNWETNKCSSKYIFFSGYMNHEGEPLRQTISNFNECVKRFAPRPNVDSEKTDT